MKLNRQLILTKTERQAALETIEQMETLFRKGEGWIRNEESSEDDDGNPTYCLIGAVKEADGSGEEIARILIASVIKESLSIVDSDVDDQVDTITSYNDNDADSYKDIAKVLRKAKALLQKNSIGM